MVDLIAWAVSIGAAVCILTGYGLGSIGDSWAKRRAKARAARLASELAEERGARQAAEAARERAEARAAVATAARDDYRDQLVLAEEALAAATYTNATPVPKDPGTAALLADLADEPPEDDAPRGSHHRPEPCLAITTDPHFPGYRELVCEHDAGHHGDHESGDVEWDDDGPTRMRGERL
jgi:hypothetical protein